MARQKTIFLCSECQHESVRWLGNCPTCSSWNSFVEQIAVKPAAGGAQKFGPSIPLDERMRSINEIEIGTRERMLAGMPEWDRVIGGGILAGSFIILTGDPGIGKSTLLLQVADKLARSHSVLYFSSEESLEQVKHRALRLGLAETQLRFSDESCLEVICETALHEKPDIIILDSIQSCYLSSQPQTMPGTIAQLREAAFQLMRLAKANNIAVLVTGHITKDGQMAGPKLLEHMVDAVFYLQGEDRWQTRVLRSVKNRFGTINEIGFFEMDEQGLIEITNINQQLLKESSNAQGASLVCSIEGSRPLLVELQALCVESRFGMPQRVVSGMDPKQVVLIAAILEKYLHIKLSSYDIFFKVSGGFKIKESGSDLGIALALLSSYFQKPLPPQSLALGEISLTGQIKTPGQTAMRVKEAEKFGISTILGPSNLAGASPECRVIHFKNVYDTLRLFPEE